jgi:hypothetical protein
MLASAAVTQKHVILCDSKSLSVDGPAAGSRLILLSNYQTAPYHHLSLYFISEGKKRRKIVGGCFAAAAD